MQKFIHLIYNEKYFAQKIFKWFKYSHSNISPELNFTCMKCSLALFASIFSHCAKSAQIRSFFWSVFSRIQAEYRDLLRISPHSAGVWENTDQKKLWTWTLFKQWLGPCNPLTTNVFQIYKNQSIGLHCKLISIWWGTLVVNGVIVLTTKFIWLVSHVICCVYFCEASSSQLVIYINQVSSAQVNAYKSLNLVWILIHVPLFCRLHQILVCNKSFSFVPGCWGYYIELQLVMQK